MIKYLIAPFFSVTLFFSDFAKRKPKMITTKSGIST